MGLLDEMRLVRKVKAVAQDVVDENKGSEPMWATVRSVDETTGKPTVEVDGGELVECASWANECYVGDRVMIEVRNHQVIQTSNATNKATSSTGVTVRLEELEDRIESEVSDMGEGLSTLIRQTTSDVLTTVSAVIQSTTQLWYAKSTSAAPSKPQAEVEQDQQVYGAWTSAMPAYNESYKHYFYCYQYMLADESFAWSDVVYDPTIKDAETAAAAAAAAASDAQETADDAKETADLISTMVRTYNAGVLVCKTGQSVGALVNANGSFDIVKVTWSGSTPTAGNTYGTFYSDGLTVYNGLGSEIAHLGYGDGNNASGSTESAPYFTFGRRSNGVSYGNNSVVEGLAGASGAMSHAGGYGSLASGVRAFAFGLYALAQYENQFAVGKYNEGKSTSLFEVGNGTQSSSRSNAFEVSTGGNVKASGTITDGSGNVLKSVTGKDIFGSSSIGTTNRPVYWTGSALSAMGGELPISYGGTGAADAATARSNLGAAASNHTHSGYASSSHSHTLSSLGLFPTVDTGSLTFGSNVSVSSNSWTQIGSGKSFAAGTWIIVVRFTFNSTGTGRRQCMAYVGDATSGGSVLGSGFNNNDSEPVVVNITSLRTLNSSTTLYARAKVSGTAQTVTAAYKAIRLF